MHKVQVSVVAFLLSKIKIEHLELFGKISKEGIERIKRLLPDSDIKINGSRI